MYNKTNAGEHGFGDRVSSYPQRPIPGISPIIIFSSKKLLKCFDYSITLVLYILVCPGIKPTILEVEGQIAYILDRFSSCNAIPDIGTKVPLVFLNMGLDNRQSTATSLSIYI